MAGAAGMAWHRLEHGPSRLRRTPTNPPQYPVRSMESKGSRLRAWRTLSNASSIVPSSSGTVSAADDTEAPSSAARGFNRGGSRPPGTAGSKRLILTLDDHSATSGQLTGTITDALPATAATVKQDDEKAFRVWPGCTVSGTVSVPSFKDATHLEVVLSGKCGATIMGKPRWQSSAMASAYASAGPASSVPVTFREEHHFLRMEERLWPRAPAAALAGDLGSESTATVSAPKESSDASSAGGDFRFSFVVPRLKQCTCQAASYTLPPSVDLRSYKAETPADRSTIEIAYSVTAILHRKGLLRRNAKVKIPLLMLDDAPPDYTRQETKVARARGRLKYAAANDQAPQVECEFSFACPTSRGGTIPYTVSYRMVSPDEPFHAAASDWELPPPDPEGATGDTELPPLYQTNSDPLLGQIKPRVEVTLSRFCRTRPTESPQDGIEQRWPGYMLVLGKNDQNLDYPSQTDEGPSQGPTPASLQGALKLPPREVSAFICNAEVRHMLHARIFSQALMRPINIQTSVYLPSGS